MLELACNVRSSLYLTLNTVQKVSVLCLLSIGARKVASSTVALGTCPGNLCPVPGQLSWTLNTWQALYPLSCLFSEQNACLGQFVPHQQLVKCLHTEMSF